MIHPVRDYQDRIKLQKEYISNGVHKPVLQKEVLKYLDPKANENFIDCTINGGGHALAILERVKPKGKVLGIDSDKEVISQLEPRNNLILVCDNFVNLKEIARELKFKPDGILFDLGMSSWHLDKSGKGFSFLKDEPLDMRYSEQTGLTAEKIVNEYSLEELEKIIKEYGEDRFARKIAKKIVEKRKKKRIKTTLELAEAIRFKQKRIHFATRTFQALRIAVNDELNVLAKAIPQAVDILASGGRLAVISFHSLEDRIVKNLFKNLSSQEFEILTDKPIKPSLEEITSNHRSRSAKLRAIKHMGDKG